MRGLLFLIMVLTSGRVAAFRDLADNRPVRMLDETLIDDGDGE